MSNLDHDTKNLLLGAVIGGIVAVGAVSIFRICKQQKCTPLQMIGEVVTRACEIVKDHRDSSDFLKEIDKKLEKNEGNISTFLELTAVGIELWKKFRRGA